MRFTVQLEATERAELEVVNPLRPGGTMLLRGGTRVDSSGVMGDVIYGATIIDVWQELEPDHPASPGATVVTLELPMWRLIPDVGGPVDSPILAALQARMNSQDTPTPPMTAETFCWDASRVPGSS